MKILVILVSFFILFAQVATADQSVGRVGHQTEYVQARVVHDTTMRTVSDLSNRESYFLSTVPSVYGRNPETGYRTSGTLRDAVLEMLLARVIHVPSGGVYRTGDSDRYWSMYQVWTAPYKTKVPVIRGLDGQDGRPGRNGRNGRDGAPGPMGPQGPQGPATVITVAMPQPMYAIVSQPQPYGQVVVPGASGMGGFVYAPSNSNFNLSATGGKGGTGGGAKITNNNSNSSANTNVNNNPINIGSGSSKGVATGDSFGMSISGPDTGQGY